MKHQADEDDEDIIADEDVDKTVPSCGWDEGGPFPCY